MDREKREGGVKEVVNIVRAHAVESEESAETNEVAKSGGLFDNAKNGSDVLKKLKGED